MPDGAADLSGAGNAADVKWKFASRAFSVFFNPMIFVMLEKSPRTGTRRPRASSYSPFMQ